MAGALCKCSAIRLVVRLPPLGTRGAAGRSRSVLQLADARKRFLRHRSAHDGSSIGSSSSCLNKLTDCWRSGSAHAIGNLNPIVHSRFRIAESFGGIRTRHFPTYYGSGSSLLRNTMAQFVLAAQIRGTQARRFRPFCHLQQHLGQALTRLRRPLMVMAIKKCRRRLNIVG